MSDETFAGEPLDPYALKDEITRLRAENERLKKENWEHIARGYALINMLPDETLAGDIQTARRNIGGVVDSLRAENERLRWALIDTIASLVASVSLLERGGKKAAPSDKMFAQMLVDYKNSIDSARAAYEGVTEPASPWRDIESAPKDGTWIFIYKDSWHGAVKAKWGEVDGVDELFMGWVFQDEFLCIGCAEGCLGYNEDIEDGYMPTHWMPLPEPPR